MKLALSFDDVLLVPQYNEVASRKDVDTSVRVSERLTLKIPIISSCMDTVTESDMAITMWRAGGLGILHRYNTIEQQLEMFKKVQIGRLAGEELVLFDRHPSANCAVAVGATGDYMERICRLYEQGATIFCVDVAHGDSKLVVEAVKKIRMTFPDITLIAGNVATGEGCLRLGYAGADAVRVGIGGGSLCTTRLMTGSGVPTLQSIMDCYEYMMARGLHVCLLADGGIKSSGDIVKSIAAGAGAVILGQLLAATDKAPGALMPMADGTLVKVYRGMSSFAAQADWRPEKKNEIVPEGEETLLPYKGTTSEVLHQLVGGLRSGMTYSGAHRLEYLTLTAKFTQITHAGWAESKPHAKQ